MASLVDFRTTFQAKKNTQTHFEGVSERFLPSGVQRIHQVETAQGRNMSISIKKMFFLPWTLCGSFSQLRKS